MSAPVEMAASGTVEGIRFEVEAVGDAFVGRVFVEDPTRIGGRKITEALPTMGQAIEWTRRQCIAAGHRATAASWTAKAEGLEDKAKFGREHGVGDGLVGDFVRRAEHCRIYAAENLKAAKLEEVRAARRKQAA